MGLCVRSVCDIHTVRAGIACTYHRQRSGQTFLPLGARHAHTHTLTTWTASIHCAHFCWRTFECVVTCATCAYRPAAVTTRISTGVELRTLTRGTSAGTYKGDVVLDKLVQR
jgi:hypothetical protein